MTVSLSTLVGATSIAGALTVPSGGTGATTLTLNSVLLGNGSSALQSVAPSTSGNVLTSNGTTWASSAPTAPTALGTPVSGNFSTGTFTWPTFNQNTSGTAAGLSSTLAVGSGGTGATTLTLNSVLLGNGSSALQSVAPSTSGNVLTSNGTTWASSAPTAPTALGTPVSGNFSTGTFTWPTFNQNTSGTAASFTSTTQNSQFNSIGVGTAASATAGEIRAINNVTAYYSDERLKTNIVNIPNALEKILQLNGVTFNANELAATYGYTNQQQQVGVIAQQVESVLPQIVVPAPFDIGQDLDGNEYSISGENYKTVQYDKLVPLLIEAIKELTIEVNKLKGGK